MSSKGAQTRERILERAYRLASRDGLEGLSLSRLAAESGMSKSGLFAHFDSKEQLQIEVLRQAAERFRELVWGPALRAPRGEARIRRVFDGWLRWLDDPTSPGGCVFAAASIELDDREGKPRDFLVQTQREQLGSIARAAEIAVAEGQFRPDLDAQQFAFDVYGIVASYQHQRRLLRDPEARARAERAFERILAAARRPD